MVVITLGVISSCIYDVSRDNPNDKTFSGKYVWTKRITGGTQDWSSIAISGDGTYMAAVEGGGYTGNIYTSSNRGVDWTAHTSTPGSQIFWSVGISDNGSTIVSAAYNGKVWYSTNYGSSWIDSNSNTNNWFQVGISGNGAILAACINDGKIWTSTIPNNFVEKTASAYIQWRSISLSSTGQYIVAVTCPGAENGVVYTSSDYGESWTQRTAAGSQYFVSSAISSDGKTMVVGRGTSGGKIQRSTDYGATWTDITMAGTHAWWGLALSSDGTKIAAADNLSGSYLYISLDSGNTWIAQTDAGTAQWMYIAASRDFTTLAGCAYDGNFWVGHLE